MKFLNLLFLSLLFLSSAKATVLKVVAAENFYGSIAGQVGGSSVEMFNIMNNPNQDPHEFQASVMIAKAVADADLVIYNGIGYDSWIEKLLSIQGKPGRIVINVAHLVGAKAGDNPHLWYDPQTMILLAGRLNEVFQQPVPYQKFLQSMGPLETKIHCLKSSHRGICITATEPLFGPMSQRLQWKMLNLGYQQAIMNEIEPSFRQIIDFQKSLSQKEVRLLFYNSQVTNPSTEQMKHLAEQVGIPVVGLSELQPARFKNYQEWIMSELADVERALQK